MWLAAAKFCPNCGKNLGDAIESSDTSEEQKEAGLSGQTAIYSLGAKLE